MLTFLFAPDGRVTPAAFEIAKGTCAYERFDAWGTLPALYTPGLVADAAKLIAAEAALARARLPVRPVADLGPATAPSSPPPPDPSRPSTARSSVARIIAAPASPATATIPRARRSTCPPTRPPNRSSPPSR